MTQEKLAILKIDAFKVFQIPEVVFTDGNAASQNTEFLTEPDEFNKLSWPVIKNLHFCFTRELKRRKSAEILIPRHLSIDAISGIIVYNEAARNDVKQHLQIFFKLSQELLPRDWVDYWISRCEINDACYF